MNHTGHDEENYGPQFNLDLYLKAREKAMQAVHQTAEQIVPGMNEQQCIEILNRELSEAQIEKFWHPTKFRVNNNTTKSFRDASEDLVLKESDLFFVDIGPVFYNHEADYGETFVIGNDPKLINLRDATKKVFEATQKAWKENRLTGQALYEFAVKEALKYDLILNTNMYGHRLGDFPHALYFKGKLGTLNFSPAPHLWILEIHLLDESIGRGAFFEDLLI